MPNDIEMGSIPSHFKTTCENESQTDSSFEEVCVYMACSVYIKNRPFESGVQIISIKFHFSSMKQ